jgi:hypothetical protein
MVSKFEQRHGEPLFRAIRQDDPKMLEAFRRASESIAQFQELAAKPVGLKCAKLRFRDPDESERLGADQFLFLWLSDVNFHEREKLFSGTFFEVPPEFEVASGWQAARL